jgi:hypothetical protein
VTHRLNQFEWTVAQVGYKFQMLKAVQEKEERLFLTASISFGKRYPGCRYSPQPGLFRHFAELKPEQDQILAFANQWGTLTAGVPLVLENNALGVGEPLDLWEAEIRDLSLTVRLFELINRGDVKGLGRYIKWDGSSGVRFERADDKLSEPRFQGTIPWLADVLFDGTEDLHDGRWIASRVSNTERLELFQVGDLIGPAWYQLQHMVNEKLAGNVSARLLWNSSHTRLSLHQVPKDLISALWLQLARAMEGNREYQQCEECRNWFEVASPDGGRKDKRFCSTACRARFWRKAKKREEGGEK